MYNEFNQYAPRSVLDYFNENWHTIRNEWVDGIKPSEEAYGGGSKGSNEPPFQAYFLKINS